MYQVDLKLAAIVFLSAVLAAGLLIGLFYGVKALVKRLLAKDQRIDELQEAVIEFGYVMKTIRLKYGAEIAVKGGAINLDGIVKAIRDCVRAYDTEKDPDAPLKNLSENFAWQVAERAERPQFVDAAAKAIAKEPRLLAAIDRVQQEAQAAQAEAEALKAWRASGQRPPKPAAGKPAPAATA